MIDRRAFLQRLGAMAAAGTLAPSVVALLPIKEIDGYRFVWADPVGNPIDDMIAAMNRIRAEQGVRPNTIAIDPTWWPELVAETRRHHPELLEAT